MLLGRQQRGEPGSKPAKLRFLLRVVRPGDLGVGVHPEGETLPVVGAQGDFQVAIFEQLGDGLDMAGHAPAVERR